jgi:hypothetical protein
MPDIECRPELHHATTEEQYDQFHTGMNELGLGRTLVRDGKVWKLPKAVYLGLNLATPFYLLDIKINALAIKITGNRCKLMLSYVDAATIYISGLEEVVSPWVQLLAGFPGYDSPYSTVPIGDGLSALARLADSGQVPSALPNF